VQPHGQRRLAAHVRRFLDEQHENRLRDVFGPMRIAKLSACRAVDEVNVPAHEPVDRRAIPMNSPRVQQLDIAGVVHHRVNVHHRRRRTQIGS
jgi:hypothetical protein